MYNNKRNGGTLNLFNYSTDPLRDNGTILLALLLLLVVFTHYGLYTLSTLIAFIVVFVFFLTVVIEKQTAAIADILIKHNLPINAKNESFVYFDDVNIVEEKGLTKIYNKYKQELKILDQGDIPHQLLPSSYILVENALYVYHYTQDENGKKSGQQVSFRFPLPQ